MASRNPNLDPQLAGPAQPQSYQLPGAHPAVEGFAAHVRAPPPSSDAYNSQSARLPSGYNAASQPAPQPYFYPSTPQHGGTPASASVAGSIDAHSYPARAVYPTSNQMRADNLPFGQSDPDKRVRACDSCRGLKVRCNFDEGREGPCKRCTKAARPCVVSEPTQRKQKRADPRVVSLEKRIDDLMAALKTQPAAPQTAFAVQSLASPSDYPPNMPDPNGAVLHGFEPAHKRRRTDVDGPGGLGTAHDTSQDPLNDTREVYSTARQAEYHQPPSLRQTSDVSHASTRQPAQDFMTSIDALVSPNHASTLFRCHLEQMDRHIPAVVFPKGTIPEDVRREKPILYLCVVSAASFGQVPLDTSLQLQKEALGVIAERVFRDGDKSLELIQAMQVLALWYKPPRPMHKANFYQIIHVAAVMALDIGLGRRFNLAKSEAMTIAGQKVVGWEKSTSQDSDTLEARRAWLGCYYLCASASTVLRRPNLVRWTEYMKECIEVLETSADAAPSDKLFCQHVKIQHICEEIGLQFLMDDTAAQISINDPKVTFALNVLESQLKQWKEQVPDECRIPSLMFFEHATSLYLHEIAMHFNHNVEDFHLPFTEESLKSVTNPSAALTLNQVAAIEACLRAAHGTLDTLLNFDIVTIITLPMLLYVVRCIYALVMLIKLHVIISAPNSELSKLMEPQSLKVEQYLDDLISLFSEAADERQAKPERLLHIFRVMKDWMMSHKKSLAAQQEAGAAAPSTGQRAEDKVGQGSGTPYGQTPLHMLSQVAAGQKQDGAASVPTDWTFNSPNVVDYHQMGPHPGGKGGAYQQGLQGAPAAAAAAKSTGDQGVLGMMDSSAPAQNYGWNLGFEQAMDMTLGYMDGLQADSLDKWFLNENMGPFDINDMGAAAGGRTGNW